jgi:hypothetical protein
MRKQTTTRNPPSTNYQKPTERKFYIWRHRYLRYGHSLRTDRGWGDYPWLWMCTLCDPPSYGWRSRAGGWQAIISTSMPRHFAHKRAHHQWVSEHRSLRESRRSNFSVMFNSRQRWAYYRRGKKDNVTEKRWEI